MIYKNKKRWINVILLCGMTLLSSFTAKGDDSIATPLRPVASSFMVDLGRASILDTYLTPIRYKGGNARLGYERLQAMRFAPQKWVMQLNCGVGFSSVDNIVKNRTMYSLMVDFDWGMMRKWNNVIVPGLKLYLGGNVGFDGGVIYNQYNSNNPVSAKIRFSAGVTGMAAYDIKVGRLPITLRYQASLPVLGAFFSPGYGESFYEIYLGNRKGLAHFGWWGNRFDMTNFLAADLHLGATCLRVGYRGTIETSWVNNLSTQIFTNNFVIGVGGEWISLNPSKKINADAAIISAIY